MELVYFTVIAAVIYLLADRILRQLEKYLDRTLEHRSLIFFAILLSLALTTFSAIRYFSQ
ncbi:MAG: hypothetical protein OEM91_13750 [Hyphomicrobiales bacterium]|nr:hypothetical protein [Hyphomicrobiales bacterium]